MTVQTIIDQLDELLENGIRVGIARQNLATAMDTFGAQAPRTLEQSTALDDLVTQYMGQRIKVISIIVQLTDEHDRMKSAFVHKYPDSETKQA